MHKIMFHYNDPAPIPMESDGKKVTYRDNLKIDQFFGSAGCLKTTGFPSSDVSLFERLARAGGSALDSLTSRISPTQPNKVDKRSDKEKLDTVRPAWCQTAAEVSRFEESMYQRSERNKPKDEPKEAPKVETETEPVSAPASE